MVVGILFGCVLTSTFIYDTKEMHTENESVKDKDKPLPLFYPSDIADAFFTKLTTTASITNSSIRVNKVENTLVQANPDFLACNAPKTGCTVWRYFWEYVNTGKRWNASQIERNSRLIHLYHGELVKLNNGVKPIWYHDRTDSEIVTMLENYEMIAIGRNPYVRFLSSYQNWLMRTKKNEMEVPFNKFTNEFLELKRGDKSKNKFFEGIPVDHIDSISKFCQIGMYNYTVLRVEEQALWFDQFLTRYHLKEKMNKYVNHGNFVFSSGLREDSFVKNFTKQISGKESWPSEMVKTSHQTGSAQKIYQYYTPAIAKEVTEITFNDLVNFGYPLWDGTVDTFRYV